MINLNIGEQIIYRLTEDDKGEFGSPRSVAPGIILGVPGDNCVNAIVFIEIYNDEIRDKIGLVIDHKQAIKHDYCEVPGTFYQLIYNGKNVERMVMQMFNEGNYHMDIAIYEREECD